MTYTCHRMRAWRGWSTCAHSSSVICPEVPPLAIQSPRSYFKTIRFWTNSSEQDMNKPAQATSTKTSQNTEFPINIHCILTILIRINMRKRGLITLRLQVQILTPLPIRFGIVWIPGLYLSILLVFLSQRTCGGPEHWPV